MTVVLIRNEIFCHIKNMTFFLNHPVRSGKKKMALKLLHVFKQLLNEFNNYQFERKEKNLKSKNDIGQYPVTSP